MQQEMRKDPDDELIEKMAFRERVANVFTKIHQQTIELSNEYAAKRKKNVYITPVLFTSMFKLFAKLLERKNHEIETERSKYEQGV
jgi:hypothetical protein